MPIGGSLGAARQDVRRGALPVDVGLVFVVALLLDQLIPRTTFAPRFRRVAFLPM